MKIAYRNEVIFKFVYFFLIIFSGLFISMYTQGPAVLILTASVSILYITLSFRKEIHRLRQVQMEFPTGWRSIIEKYSNFYNSLEDSRKIVFEKDIKIFLSGYNVRSIRGEGADLKTRVLVAAGVATILHGRKEWEPPFKDGVVVYPGETFDSEFMLHKGDIAGMAGERRPLLVTKDILERSFRHSSDGYNSLLHEIAHYFDFENPSLSGVPLIGAEKEKIEAWIKVMEKERRRVIEGDSFLRSYAGTNEAEFFAVATEFFFERPEIMFQKNPALYKVLGDFYNLDTKKILNR